MEKENAKRNKKPFSRDCGNFQVKLAWQWGIFVVVTLQSKLSFLDACATETRKFQTPDSIGVILVSGCLVGSNHLR